MDSYAISTREFFKSFLVPEKKLIPPRPPSSACLVRNP